MHWAGPGMGPMPGLIRKLLKLGFRGSIQTAIRPGAQPATHGLQKNLLIHRLIGTALLQPAGAIGRDQQQRLTGTIRLHSSRQQIGHCSARCGDHCSGVTRRRGTAQSKKRC